MGKFPYTKEDILKITEIKERLLRFWVKEYKLKKYVNSSKAGNTYSEKALFYIKVIKFLKNEDIYSTKGIVQIVENLKKGNNIISEMEFFKSFEQDFINISSENNTLTDIEKHTENISEKNNDTGDEYYFNLLRKAETLISQNNYFDAINLLTLISNNSETYNAIAREMISLLESSDEK